MYLCLCLSVSVFVRLCVRASVRLCVFDVSVSMFLYVLFVIILFVRVCVICMSV